MSETLIDRFDSFSDYTKHTHLRDKITAETITNLLEVINDLARSHRIPIEAVLEYRFHSVLWKDRENKKEILDGLPIKILKKTD